MIVRTAAILFWTLVLSVAVPASWAQPADETRDHLQRGRALLQEGKPAEAIAELRRAVEEAPEGREANLTLARAHLAARDADSATVVYRAFLDRNPADVEALQEFVTFLLLNRRPDLAEEYAGRAVERVPAEFWPHLLLGRARAAKKDWAGAARALGAAIERKADEESLRVELARYQLSAGERGTAEETLRQGLHDIPPSRGIRVALANLLASQQRYEEADALIAEALNLSPDDSQAHRVAAAYHLKRGHREQAEQLLTKALELAAGNEAQELETLADLANLYSATGDLESALATLEKVRTRAPDHALTLARLANLHLLRNDPGQAQPLIDRLTEQLPNDWSVRLLRARLDLSQGRPNDALVALREIVEVAPDAMNAHLYLGKAYATTRRWEEASASYLAVLEEMPDHFFANLDLAKVYLQMGRPRDALERLDRVLRVKPDFDEAIRFRADALLAAGEADEAERLYRDLIARSPDLPVLQMRLAQSLEAQGRDTEALTAYAVARQKLPGAVELALRQMALLDRMGRHAQVDEVGAAFLAQNGEVPMILNSLAVHAADVGDPEAAAGYLERSLAADPRDARTRELQARLLMAQGDLEGAQGALDVALASQPDRVSALLLLSAVHEARDEYDLAGSVYARVLKIEPTNPVAANNLAVIYSLDESRRDEAIRLARIALEGAPNSAFTLDTLGWLQHLRGDGAEAVQHLERAHELLPDHPEIAYHLGMAYAQSGAPEKARHLLRQAVSTAEEVGWREEARRALEQLEKTP